MTGNKDVLIGLINDQINNIIESCDVAPTPAVIARLITDDMPNGLSCTYDEVYHIASTVLTGRLK